MNNVTLIGRLTRDPELKYVGDSQTAIVEFIIAVDRSYKSNDNNTDFILIQTWNKQAENCNSYLGKGDLVGISGEIRIDRYTNKQGENKNVTKVVAKLVKFLNTTKNERHIDNKYYDSSNIFKSNDSDNNNESVELPF